MFNVAFGPCFHLLLVLQSGSDRLRVCVVFEERAPSDLKQKSRQSASRPHTLVTDVDGDCPRVTQRNFIFMVVCKSTVVPVQERGRGGGGGGAVAVAGMYYCHFTQTLRFPWFPQKAQTCPTW